MIDDLIKNKEHQKYLKYYDLGDSRFTRTGLYIWKSFCCFEEE